MRLDGILPKYGLPPVNLPEMPIALSDLESRIKAIEAENAALEPKEVVQNETE